MYIRAEETDRDSAWLLYRGDRRLYDRRLFLFFYLLAFRFSLFSFHFVFLLQFIIHDHHYPGIERAVWTEAILL
jgi:hypothetical protein